MAATISSTTTTPPDRRAVARPDIASPPPAPDDHPGVRRLRQGHLTVGVIGLGYVGLPLLVAAAQRGHAAIGFDLDPSRIERLRAGRSHVEDVPDARLAEVVADDAVRFTADEASLRNADVVLLAVPSPLGRNREPDTSFIRSAIGTVSRIVRPGQLVVLESTTYPGTTDELLVPAVTATGLRLDEDVFIAYSPERVDPGNALGTEHIPKVVGGVSARSTAAAAAVYRRLVDEVHPVSTARAAELTKLLENTYRAVNIAMVNELTQLAEALDIDIWEVIDAAATKPFGFQAFYPGPGVGGHCIPLDPQFLAWRARELRSTTRFIDLAEEVNRHMPEYVVRRVSGLLNSMQRALRGSRVLGVGAAYKRNVGDDRESPAVDVLRLLAAQGAEVSVYDPHVSPELLAGHGFQVVADLDEVDEHDLAVILTDHDAIDLSSVARAAPLVFDTRNAFRRRGLTVDNVWSL